MADYKQYFKKYKTNRSLLKIKKDEEQQIIRELLEIQTPSIKAQVITDMPITHGEDNSPVERFAVQSEERQEKLNSRLKIVQNEVFSLQCEVNKAEACLDILRDRERFVINHYYIEEAESWEQVANAYQCHYREWKSIRQLINYRNNALYKITEFFKIA